MKNIESSAFVPGRIYSVVYDSEVKMVRTKRATGAENPLAESNVTVRRVSSVQAAGNKTWTNFLGKSGEVPAGKEPAWTVSDYNSCIVIGKKDGAEKLRALPRGITKEEYFIESRLATPSEVETIRTFKKSQGSAPFVTLNLSKLENVLSVEGEAE